MDKAFGPLKGRGWGGSGALGSAGVERGSDCVTGMGRRQDLFWILREQGARRVRALVLVPAPILAFVIQEHRTETGAPGWCVPEFRCIGSTPA